MLTLDGQQNILDKPDGKPMDGIAGLKIEKVNVVKVEGDWVLVRELGNEDGYRGWVRWRKDRDILVGCLLSHDSRWQQAEFEKRN